MISLQLEQTLGLAQLQDQGRFGCRHLGITQGGALDWLAAAQANRLLGNPPTAGVIEMPYGGVSLRIQGDTTLALCGADLQASLDGIPLVANSRFPVARGQLLRCAAPVCGVRGYLAAPQGFQAPQQLGSSATVSREGLGGLQGDGRPLQTGDRLYCAARQLPAARLQPEDYFDLTGSAQLDTLFVAEHAAFTARSLFALVNQRWQVDQRADRMGVRLLGPRLQYQGPGLISTGIPLGSIQVPPDGQPLILLQDRQTIGGYPRIGALTPLAVARLAQCAPGQGLQLRPMGQQAAERQGRGWLAKLQQPLY